MTSQLPYNKSAWWRVTFFFLIIITQNFNIVAQTVYGQVLDSQTNEPLPFTSVYFNNSYIGTTSDVDGYFKLDVSNNSGQKIIISHVGYYSIELNDYVAGEEY